MLHQSETTLGYNRRMTSSRPELTVLFAVVAQLSGELRKKIGTDETASRLNLIQELVTRLPRKYLLSASRDEIQSAGRAMIGEGRSPEEMKAVQSTLDSLYQEFLRAGALAYNPMRETRTQRASRGANSPPEVLMAVNLRTDQVALTRRLLEPTGITVHTETSHPRALDRIVWFPFTFFLCTVPPVAPVPFLETIRASGSLCRSAGVILLAKNDQIENTKVFVGRGANRVIAAAELEKRLPDIVTELGMVSERTKVRLRVYVDLEDGNHTEIWHSENISATGMLVRTQEKLATGTELDLQFTVPGDDLPIHASAEVVRGTTFAREDFSGLAVRFLSFVGEGQHRLDLFLRKKRF